MQQLLHTLISPFSTATAAVPAVLPLCFTFFLLTYLFAYNILFRRWPPSTRPEASSCLISLFHGTPAVFLASFSLFSHPSTFSSLNTPPQSAVLDFSIAYFLVDLLHYLVFCPGEVLFIGHHLATLFVFITCRYLVGHGAFSILSLLILAEVTSFCQNVWTLAGMRRRDSSIAARVYALLSPPFYAFYSVVRGLLGPYFVWRMGQFYWSGAADLVVPRWVWVSWMVVVVGAISVSILWVANLWVELHRERKGRLEKKHR
ncbi:TLC domain-containing protein At5g14285 [Linum grandiflorum]